MGYDGGHEERFRSLPMTWFRHTMWNRKFKLPLFIYSTVSTPNSCASRGFRLRSLLRDTIMVWTPVPYGRRSLLRGTGQGNTLVPCGVFLPQWTGKAPYRHVCNKRERTMW